MTDTDLIVWVAIVSYVSQAIIACIFWWDLRQGIMCVLDQEEIDNG